MPKFDAGAFYEALVAGEDVPELAGRFFWYVHDDLKRKRRASSASAKGKPTLRFLRLRGFDLIVFKSADDVEPLETVDLHDVLNVRVPSQVPRIAKYFRQYDGGFDLVTLRNGTLAMEIAARDQETFACFCALTSFKSVTIAAPVVYLSDSQGGNGNEVLPSPPAGGVQKRQKQSKSSSSASSSSSSGPPRERTMERMFACLRGSMLLLYRSKRELRGDPLQVLDLTDLRSVKQPSLQAEAREFQHEEAVTTTTTTTTTTTAEGDLEAGGGGGGGGAGVLGAAAAGGSFDLMFHDCMHTFVPCTGDAVSVQLCATLVSWQSKQMLHISALKEGVVCVRTHVQASGWR
jgi:hypothetical protein